MGRALKPSASQHDILIQLLIDFGSAGSTIPNWFSTSGVYYELINDCVCSGGMDELELLVENQTCQERKKIEFRLLCIFKKGPRFFVFYKI